MRQWFASATLALCAGCGPVQGPNDVMRIEGAFCEKGKPDEVVRETDADVWRVTMFFNDSEVRDVVEDGVHRFVEFRNCASRTCRVSAEFAPTGEEAIESCRNATNLPRPLVWR
jgi:SH3-like domain-containing protein